MKVENLISVVFTEEELKEALICFMEFDLNDTTPGTPEYEKRSSIIEHARKSTVAMEWNDGKFYLCIDGVASTENF